MSLMIFPLVISIISKYIEGERLKAIAIFIFDKFN